GVGVARTSPRVLALIGVVAWPPGSAAQTPPAPPTPAAQLGAVSGDDDAGRTDLIDLLRLWRNKPPATGTGQQARWTIVPILSSKPGLGVQFRAGADVEFKLGEPAT